MAGSLISLLTAFTLGGCGGGSDDTPQQRAFSRIEAPWAYTNLSAEYVASTESEWNAVWHLHEPGWVPAQAPAKVNFDSQMVVGLTRGTGPSGCDTLKITRLTERLETIEVEYVQAVPLPYQVCTASLSPLTDFVVTAKSSKPVRFLKTDA